VIGLGLDYSARRVSGRAVRDAGYDFVLRYLWFPGQRVSYLDAAERADLIANGVDVHLIYEENTDDPAGGWNAGVRMGSQAVQSARATGAPAGTTIFFCADAWLAAHGIPVATAMAFLDGARSVVEEYTLGAYGFADFVFAAAEGHADRFWLAGAEIPDESRPDWLHLYQWNNGRVHVDGVECDLNKLYRPLAGVGVQDMPILIKGDATDAMYAVTSDGQDFMKRHINGLEANLLEKAGVRTITLPQAEVDAIPDMWAGLTNQLNQAVKSELGALNTKVDAGFAELRDDEANIIAAIRELPTDGRADIPTFVSAVVPTLAPALPKGVTVEQFEATLVEVLVTIRPIPPPAPED
jgi:hypothetical protein